MSIITEDYHLFLLEYYRPSIDHSMTSTRSKSKSRRQSKRRRKSSASKRSREDSDDDFVSTPLIWTPRANKKHQVVASYSLDIQNEEKIAKTIADGLEGVATRYHVKRLPESVADQPIKQSEATNLAESGTKFEAFEEEDQPIDERYRKKQKLSS
ncbi:hypothetical protein Fot_30571 [Forsythia ovata]|uniref:Uncharacterized protein n=1 Tax=Forsythia ovata TaxID=205694 RepID=A0ABD1TV59_9LAMI